MQLLITLQNLHAHCTEEVKYVCRECHVLLCYLPKERTESLQMIDMDYSRSVHCDADRYLDK